MPMDGRPLTVAQQALVEAHRGWAVGRILDRYRFTWRREPDELRAIALYALVIAASRFDPQVGVAFTTYAQHVISGHVRDERRRLMRLEGWATRRVISPNGRLAVGMVQVVTRDLIPVESPAAAMNPVAGYDDDLDRASRFQRLAATFLKFAPDQLSCAVIRDWFREIPMADIAHRRGLTLSKVKNTIFRCKARVRRELMSGGVAA